jgi:Carboxypeptidase regulatory-like domain
MIAIQRMSRVASIAFAAGIYVITAAGKPLNAAPGNLFQIQPNPAGMILIVVDDNGAAISKARVALVDEKTKKKFKGETDSVGQFRISDIPHGTYEITIEAFAFEPLNQIHVYLPPRVALKLQLNHEPAFVGEVSERRSPLQKFIAKLRHLF